MAYSYKGSISFGLVYIPITLHAAIMDNSISFKLLEKKTKSRVKYKKTCVDCAEKEIRNEDIIKGFEYEEGKFVLFDEEDFEKIKTPKDKSITIEQFVYLNEIDPIYYDKAYYVVPTGGEKAFQLLLEAMAEEQKAGIAKTILGNKETLILLRSKDGQMLLNTLFFSSQIKKNPCKDIQEEVKASELKLAKSLISQMSAPLEIESYQDEYKKRLEHAIQEKIQGKEIISASHEAEPKITDLMDALKASLDEYSAPKKRIVPPKKKERPRANA